MTEDLLAKNILQVIPNMESGGIERCVVEMNKFLIKQGYNSFVLTTGGKWVYLITQAGGKHIKLNVATKNPLTLFINIFRIKNLIKNNKIDLVDVMSRAPAWSVYFACKITKTPLVTTIHGNYNVGNFLFYLFKRFYNSSMMKGDYVVCVSNYIKNYALKHYSSFKKKYFESKVVVVPRGVDIEQFDPNNISQLRVVEIINKLGIPDDKKIILLPGRFADWKGQLYFLDVLKQLKEQNFLCLMVGAKGKHKSYLNKIKRKIKKLGLNNFVRIENAVSDMPALYIISNIVISSSIRGEAFGMIALEGQAMGRVVIATNHGGSVETITDGKNGFLVNYNNPIEFANRIDEVLTMNKEEKEKISKMARKNVIDNFTIKMMCERTLSVYNELLTS